MAFRERYDHDGVLKAWDAAHQLAARGQIASAEAAERKFIDRAFGGREPVVLLGHGDEEECVWAELPDLVEWLHPHAAFVAAEHLAQVLGDEALTGLCALHKRIRTVHAGGPATPDDVAALGEALRSGLAPRVGQHLLRGTTAKTYAVLAALQIAGTTRRMHAGIRGLRVCDLCAVVFTGPWQERCKHCRQDRQLRGAQRSGDAPQAARAEQRILAEVTPSVRSMALTDTGLAVHIRRARHIAAPQKPCAQCGADFAPARASHNFCTDACRQRAARRRGVANI